MTINELTKSALADAAAVKRMAEANAYQTLKEEFQPTIQRIVSQHIAEEEDEYGEEEIPLDGGEGPEEEIEFNFDFGADDDMGFAGGDDMEGGEDPFAPASDALPSEPVEEPIPGEEDDMSYEESLELEAIMKELEEADDVVTSGEPVAPVDPIDEDSGYPDKAGERKPNTEGKLTEEEIDEILGLDEMDGMEDELEEDSGYPDKAGESKPNTESYRRKIRTLESRVKTLSNEKNTAIRAITELKKTINDVNLLNAKLMFTQKIFSEHELSEEKKVKVLKAFDIAQSIREVKANYVNIMTFLGKDGKKQRPIKEGAASRPGKQLNPKKNLNEEFSGAERWKRLGGVPGYNLYD